VLAALDTQTVRPQRILLVDNGSDDVEQLKRIVAVFPACELIALGSNTGFAAANNIGIAHCADSEYIVLLNPDAFPEPDWLSTLLAAAEAYPQCGSFASRMLDHADDTLLGMR
jgi:GT2 family glycosyltransferase